MTLKAPFVWFGGKRKVAPRARNGKTATTPTDTPKCCGCHRTAFAENSTDNWTYSTKEQRSPCQ